MRNSRPCRNPRRVRDRPSARCGGAAIDFRPDKAILELGADFYDPVAPAEFPQAALRYADDHSARAIGLQDVDWIRRFAEFEPFEDSLPDPLALRYHGHQFRSYNPEIGDGRGFLYAQCRDAAGRLLDFGTKGSGQTPFSRRGDGRLTLLGGVREVLATRYLEHLGVNTSRSFCLIETGEALQRHDEPSPTRSAVLTRLQHSHIRFGTFQRQAFFGRTDNLDALVDYCRRHFYPEIQRPADLLREVALRSADLVASWMAAGFVHGVMNTDNMNMTGEVFDFGPYRFLPHYDPAFTAAYFDHGGLYAFARQPEAMGWNLGQLAQSLSLIEEDDVLIAALQAYADTYEAALVGHMFRRLRLRQADGASAFVKLTFDTLRDSRANWPFFFHDWAGGASPAPLQDYPDGRWSEWKRIYAQFEPSGPRPSTDRPATLLYDEIGALWAPIAESDDWSTFRDTLESFDRHDYGEG
ncbi:protein adenylyltransferase SelO family protein [uncultured Algimonas sp.]|uniref:protein adenylyltransferase SelO family protein n=1 Tax=uncultured Algimonas sp. TaxID=1547920 RepID=UPI002631DEDD|nr:YdiU family protein [uncultured Algimonas sp.]